MPFNMSQCQSLAWMRRQGPLTHLCDITGFATALRLIFRVALAFQHITPMAFIAGLKDPIARVCGGVRDVRLRQAATACLNDNFSVETDRFVPIFSTSDKKQPRFPAKLAFTWINTSRIILFDTVKRVFRDRHDVCFVSIGLKACSSGSHGCCWKTFYTFAYCGLVVEIPTYLLKFIFVLPFQRQSRSRSWSAPTK